MGKHLDQDILDRLERGDLDRADLDRLFDQVVEHVRELASQEATGRSAHTTVHGDFPDPVA